MNPDQLKARTRGIMAIALTAFDAHGEIDLPAMRRHLRFLVDGGIDNSNGTVVVTGSTGESGALSNDERARIWDAVLEEIGDELPVIAGVNHTDVREVLEMAAQAEKAGAAGVMALSPFYYTPRPAAVVDFYRRLSDATELGVVVYNNFEVTHYDIPIDVMRELAEIDNVVCIKDCTPNPVKMEQAVRALTPKVTVVNGHGEFLEPMAAVAGTDGFISSTANFAPTVAVDIWNARSSGDYVEAKRLRDTLTPYLDLAGRLGSVDGEPKVLALLKYLSEQVGSGIGVGRNPVLPLTAEEKAAADEALAQIPLPR